MALDSIKEICTNGQKRGQRRVQEMLVTVFTSYFGRNMDLKEVVYKARRMEACLAGGSEPRVPVCCEPEGFGD